MASLILLSAVVFALEMTAVTPLSASTSSQHIENQQEATARGVLGSAAESGALKRAVLFWNQSGERFHNASEFGYYAASPPPNAFGAMLNRTFDRNGVAYNVNLRFANADGSLDVDRYAYRGRPSDNAVRATWPVALSDDDPIYDHEGAPTGTDVGNASSFYAPAGPTSSSSVYNVVRVEVVVWRI